MIEYMISIAPMVDRTDRHFRNFIRMLNDEVVLYTEMITAQAIINGDSEHLLAFEPTQHPIVLQLAVTSVDDAINAMKIADKYGYDEININVGCPSDRVSDNKMGAYLMAYPELVRDIVKGMKNVTNTPITIKHRIGIDGRGILENDKVLDKYEDMLNFINITKQADVQKYIVHARLAVLKGLDPKQNRTIPPLRYDEVYKLKKEHPELFIEINGGIKTKEDIETHLSYVDAVMIGREAYDNPYIFAKNISRIEILEKIWKYTVDMEEKGQKLHHFLRHTQGLYHGCTGSKSYKRFINNTKITSKDIYNLIKDIKIGKSDIHE